MRSSARAEPLKETLEMKDWRCQTIPNRVRVEDGKRHIRMGKCKFVGVYLCGTQEKLEGVLLAIIVKW
jgi:hypothetical protein